jgi:hypothetical protein
MRGAVGCIVGFVVFLDLFWGEGSWGGVRGFCFPRGKGEWEDGKLVLFLEVSKSLSMEVEVSENKCR